MSAELVLAGAARSLAFGLPLVAALLVLQRFAPSVPVRARALAWWLVSLRLALWLVPLPSLPLPVMAPVERAVSIAARRLPVAASVDVPPAAATAPTPAAPRRAPSLAALAVIAWGAGVACVAVVSVTQRRRHRRVAVAARPASRDIQARVAELAARLGLTPAPEVAVADVVVPQVTGLLRSRVLLPAALALSGEELDMVLCHELAHVRRHDLRFGLVPSLVRAVLWFNPATHLAVREYLLAREAACDAAVIDVLGVAPQRYGRLLLSFCVPGPQAAAGAAATGTFTMLKRRLTMLDATTPSVRRARWAMPVCAAFALMPVTFVARPVPSAEETAPVEAVGHSVARPFHAPLHASVAEGPSHTRPHAGSPATLSARSPRHEDPQRADDHVSWVLFEEGRDEVHMSGSSADVRAARAARRGTEALFWVRRDGRQYVMRDPATIARLRALFEPMERLGRQQAEIGAKQAAIGAKMAAVGQQQAEIGARQAAIGTKQAAIGAKQASEAAKAASAPRGEAAADTRLKELENEMDALGRQMEALGAQMETFSKPMEELSKQMEPLAAEQEKLGAQMEGLARQFTADLDRLLDDARRAGTAEEVR